MVACLPMLAPRKIRGIVFEAARDFLAARVPGGLAAVERQLATPDLAEYLYQPFEVQNFYDPAPAFAIGVAAARAMSLPHLALVRAGARWAATRDSRDRTNNNRSPRNAAPFGPELAISRLGAMATHAFDISPIALQRVTPTHLRAMARGVPSSFSDWFIACVEGAAIATVEKSGATKAEVQTRAPMRNGDELAVIFEIRWS
jgi:hypothetical protein